MHLNASFRLTLKNGSFAEGLGLNGLSNSDQKNAPRFVPASLVVSSQVISTLVPVTYTAKTGKSGKAK
jgi:hypothetical protein